MLGAIEDVWLELDGKLIHCDFHRSMQPKATIVFQPGSGAHARIYFLLGGLLAKRGYHFLAIDRPGHGPSDGEQGDCTIEEGIHVSEIALSRMRRELGLPVVLMGSSLGGLLTVFGLLRGLQPDLAVAHNFVYPGKLLSMRLRARWVARHRTRPYPISELVHGFEELSADASIERYLKARDDPGFVWELSARSVSSLFGFRAAAPGRSPPLLVVTGERDTAIPAWATRWFMRWSGLKGYEIRTLAGAGHLLFLDHLDQSVPLVAGWLDEQLAV